MLGAALMMDQVRDEDILPPSVDAALQAIESMQIGNAAAGNRLGDAQPQASQGDMPRGDGGPLPMPIRRALDVSFDGITWKFRLPGVHEYPLEAFEDERPGTSMLSHTHEAEELTLVLSGQMEDGGRTYRRGDVAVADRSDHHQPQVTGNEVCVCLIVMTGAMRFTGPVGRALNIFAR